MYFAKSVEPDEPITQEAVLAAVKKSGETVLAIVTDVPSEAHVLTKRADGRRCRHYFDLAPVAKAATPAIDTEFAEECARVAALMKQPAKHGGETEEENDMTTKVNTGQQLGEMAKALAADMLAADNDHKAGVLFETRINEIRKRDECTSREAMERAVDEYPDEFAMWQGGSPVTAG